MKVHVITGEFWGKTGPVDGIAADPQYLDVTVPGRREKDVSRSTPTAAPLPMSFKALVPSQMRPNRPACCWKRKWHGEEVNIRDLSGDRTLIRFGTGDEVTVQAGPDGVRFSADLRCPD